MGGPGNDDGSNSQEEKYWSEGEVKTRPRSRLCLISADPAGGREYEHSATAVKKSLAQEDLGCSILIRRTCRRHHLLLSFN